MRWHLVVLSALLLHRVAGACSHGPSRSEPTVDDQFRQSDAVYMARLRKTTHVPIPGAENRDLDYFYIEKSSFDVLVTFKGPKLTSKTLETVTTISPGNCRISVRKPFDVIGPISMLLAYEELTKSVKQAGAIARGERKPSRKYVYSPSRVQAVREKAELSQAQLARLLNVSVRTLQNWEQARREPTGPAKALLRIVGQEPALALRALRQSAAA